MEINAKIKPFELSQEQLEAIEKIREVFIEFRERLLEIFEDLRDAFKEALKIIHTYWVRMGRALFLVRLLKMKIPYWLSNYIAENIYWVWACKWGFGLFKSN